MKEILRTNDVVLLSYLETLLNERGIYHVILDRNMSVLEGSIGALPRRVMVEDGQYDAARQLLLMVEGEHG